MFGPTLNKGGLLWHERKVKIFNKKISKDFEVDFNPKKLKY